MTQLFLIGIGTGNPEHVTLQARRMLQEADLILVPRKGAGKSDLADLRLQIINEVCQEVPVAFYDMPVRDDRLAYLARVARWHDEIAAVWSATIAAHPRSRRIALLVWGDPALYDSSLRIARRLSPRPRLTVVPGISSLQALTAAHAIPLNGINRPVVVTTGRQLRDNGWPEQADRVAVMLDSECSFMQLDPAGVHIWWGAYLGMTHELLVSGSLQDVAGQIVERRRTARAAHGWIMDIYLMQRHCGVSDQGQAKPESL